MYIGPWQEYKLAKIQDEAIQKLKHEWEEKLKSTLADEESLRHMMEPLLSKLPGMLLESRSKATRKAMTSGKQSIKPKISTNQEPIVAKVVVHKTKKSVIPGKIKEGKPKALSSMDAVAQRKKAFAQWKQKDSQEKKDASVLPAVVAPVAVVEGPPVTQLLRETLHLPPIEHSARPEIDEEDSVDEDELNSFLTWTDQLASGMDADFDTFLNT